MNNDNIGTVLEIDDTTTRPVGKQIFITATNKSTGENYEITGLLKKKDTSAVDFQQDFFINSRGGEYFFVPSVSTLKDWANMSSGPPPL
jgi:hypothetical protein